MKKIQKWEKVIQMIKEVYLFELDKKHDLDGNVSWNTARLTNHSCDPNCETEVINKQVWVVASKEIKKDAELNYDYGFEIDDWENHPCKCGAKNCIGYIIKQEHWIKLRKKIAKKRKKAKSVAQTMCPLGIVEVVTNGSLPCRSLILSKNVVRLSFG